MKSGEEGKPETEGRRINIEIEAEAAPDDAPEKPKRLIPTWAWAVTLAGSVAFLFADTDFSGLVYFLVSALAFIAFCMLLSRSIP